MALLSLGLNLDELQAANAATQDVSQQDVSQNVSNGKLRAEEKPCPKNEKSALSTEQQESLGARATSPVLGGRDARASTVVSNNHTNGNGSVTTNSESDETPKDNWSETGLQIIQSVLRDAEKKNAAPANGSTPANGRTGTPVPPNADSASNANSASEEVPALPDLEELRKLAEGISPIAVPLADFGGAGVLARVASDIQPQAFAAITQESAQEPASEKTETQHDQPVSSLATEFLSPVMEELRKKLAETDFGTERARTSVPPKSQTEVQAKTPAAPRSENKSDAIPTFATFQFGKLPGRGLLYSFIGHEVAMFAIFLFITYVIPNFREQRLIVGSLNPQDHVIYLPEVGGGTEGAKSAGGGPSKPQQASAAPARASKGFAYPGAQSILSSPPNPTNAFQTVLHPLAVRPEPLKKLVPLPNIVQMAETRLPTDLAAPKVAMPHFEAPAKPIKVRQDNDLRRNAKWDVPVKAPQLIAKADMPKLAAAEQPLPIAPKVEPKPVQAKPQEKPEEKPAPAPIKVRAEKQTEKTKKSEKEVAPPSTVQVARLEMHGKSAEPLLSLSPAPLPAAAKVPAGEARGRFAIAPGGKLDPNSVSPGKPSGTPSESPATGQEKSQAANATSELASNTGTGAGHNPTPGGGAGKSNVASGGGSAGAGSGSGNTVGAGVAGVGNGNGRGSAGVGAGRSGHGAGTGSGAGSGSGSGSFPGITIQGGEGNEGNSEAHSFTVAPQTPYQMTIVATASSGGGLADYGVFENERVYTVYVPMQRTPQEADPTWTLQYALENSSADSGGQLIAPTPVMREWPQIPADLEKAYAQQQVVVSAILGTDGKLTHISVKQSPDPHVSAPVTQALAKWVFRPAQQDNKPVPVKILLGIPLN
jgi:Gram-negative bacterial TonB protein C-terminal